MLLVRLAILLIAWLLWPAASGATVFLPGDLASLARDARAIAHGRVIDVRSRLDDRRRIERLVTVAVDRYFKGDLGDQVTFRVPGGTVGRFQRVVLGTPEVAAGDEVVIFLGARGPAIPHLLGLAQGLLHVGVDPGSGRRVVQPPAGARAAGGPIVRGDPANRPIPLDELAGRITALLAQAEAGGRP